uniref:Fibronectin type III domain-containing protein n=1 Tax=candidate division WWE3 bacterium TaxID=2053526 RepID=A0A7C4XMA5_UNCKA
MQNKNSVTGIGSKNWAEEEIHKLRSRSVNLFIAIFTVIGVLIGYYLFGDIMSSPFTRISYASTGESVLQIEVDTKFPARTKIEYGTDPVYVNIVSVNNSFEKNHKAELNGLLPDKEHAFRIVAQDTSGRFYYSKFITVQ